MVYGEKESPLAPFERSRVPNRDVFCRITGQALQFDLMIAFFAAVLSEGSDVGSCAWRDNVRRVGKAPRR